MPLQELSEPDDSQRNVGRRLAAWQTTSALGRQLPNCRLSSSSPRRNSSVVDSNSARTAANSRCSAATSSRSRASSGSTGLAAATPAEGNRLPRRDDWHRRFVVPAARGSLASSRRFAPHLVQLALLIERMSDDGPATFGRQET